MDGLYGNLRSLSPFVSCFSARPFNPIGFFFFFMTADHANFIPLTFREILILKQKITYKATRNFVPPPALIICWRAPPPVECTASTTLPATVSQHTVTSSPSLVFHGPWWCPGLIKIVPGAFRRNSLRENAPVNENSLIWNMYRLSLTRMRSLQAHSTHWRATCSYPTHGIDFTDYIRGNFKDFNIVDFIGSGQCKKVEFANIRGHIGLQLTVRFWQGAKSFFLHTDSSSSGCNFNARFGSVSSEDNFGYYGTVNSKFRCTAGDHSTTQWWFGAHL